jgi:hypothetical protein
MIEIALLATTIVSKFLVPFFKKGKDGFTEDVAKTEGEAAAEGLTKTAQALWQRITGRFDQDKEKSAVSLFPDEPEDTANVMIKYLKQRLENDADFRKELDQLVEAPVSGTDQTSWQLMAKYAGVVDARGATISGNAIVAGQMFKGAEPAESAAESKSGDS